MNIWNKLFWWTVVGPMLIIAVCASIYLFITMPVTILVYAVCAYIVVVAVKSEELP